MLRYLSRYTLIVSPSPNRRLVAADDDAIAFRWKDYRDQRPGPLEDDAASSARVHQTLPAARCCPRASTASATTGSLRPPTAPRASLTRPAHSSTSPNLPPTRKTSAGCRAGYPACAALLMPALWRSDDRHRGASRATASRGGNRRRAGTDTSASLRRRLFLVSVAACRTFRCAGSAPVAIPLDLITCHQSADHHVDALRAPATKCLLHSPGLAAADMQLARLCGRPARNSRFGAYHEIHSALLPASAQLPATSCPRRFSDAGPHEQAECLVIAGVRKTYA